jgi:hypothetical protein
LSPAKRRMRGVSSGWPDLYLSDGDGWSLMLRLILIVLIFGTRGDLEDQEIDIATGRRFII